MTAKIPPVHPGEILKEKFMKPLGLPQSELARRLKVSPKTINELVNGKRALSAEMALRLARYFDTSADMWAGIQTSYDLEMARDRIADQVKKEIRVHS